MNRRALLLVAAGAAVLAGSVALVVALRGRGDAPAARAEPAPPAGSQARPAPAGDRENAPVVTGAARADRSLDPDRPAPREVVVNGVRVRDYRTGDHPDLDLPPGVHRPSARRIRPKVTSAISDRVLATLLECKAGVPPEARGAKPRLEGQVVIAIQGGEARITSAAMQLRDVVGAALDPTRQCIEDGVIGKIAPAPDEDDLESYTISVTYAM